MSGQVIEPGYDQGIRLETRTGRRIPTRTRLPSLPEVVKAGVALWIRVFAGDIELRSVDSRYNCVGMVFASRRAWVQPEHVAQILEDDEYREIDRGRTMPGDIVLYSVEPAKSNVSHIGIIVSKAENISIGDWDIRVLSKWGAEGEYIHPEAKVPEPIGTVQSYFSERKWP